jgi:hypothetical protein
MADIRLNLVVSSDGSLDRETVKATKLADELERAQRAARLSARINSGAPPGSGGAGGGSGGSGGGSGGGAGGGGAGGAGGNAERSGYRQFRGNTGTGAESRDFARQAEGLGGLVRVYATFAANIFALTTGFSALSKATDTANMVKGLNQLGAASGRNLSGLTKQLVAASDGAISLRDAMTATAQATSGGLSGDQLLRLTAVAKNASQALGRDMPDALSRLTRGITKIEPELLDELGILVKVDAANVEYARSLGKTASALTDLEKRQAFANAAITQGEQKFNSISIDSNPYAKLAASMANISQSGLTLVNKVLTPVISLLSSSPTALAATLAGIAALLLKQAIPALGQWRAGLTAAAVASRETATRINEDFRNFQRESLSRNQPIMAQQLAQQEAAIAASRTAMNQEAIRSGRQLTTGMREIMSTPISQVQDSQIARLAATEAAQRASAARLAAAAVDPQRSTASQASKAAQAAERIAQAENTKKYTESLVAARNAERALAADRIRVQNEMTANQTRFGEARQRQMSADRALNAATRAEILSNVAQNTQVMGMAGAYAKLTEETKKARDAARAAGQSFTGLTAAGTMVRGSFAIATSAISGFMGAFMPWLLAIGLAVAALSALVEWMGTNNKQVKVFKTSIDGLNSSTASMDSTITAINNKPFLEQLTVESLKARSTALTELSDNLKKTFSNLSLADSMASDFDKFVDTWKMLWNGDLRSITTKSISAAISSGFKGATDGPAKDKFKESIAGILGTNDTSSKGIMAALKDLSGPEQFLEVVDKLNEATTKFSEETAKSTAPLVNFSDALSNAGKSASSLIAGLNLTDPMSKLGASVLNLSLSLSKVIENGPINSIVALKKLIDTPSESGFLPPDVFNKMLALRTNVDDVHASITTGISDIDKYKRELDKFVKAKEDARKNSMGDSVDRRSSMSRTVDTTKEENKLKEQISLREASLSKARESEKALVSELIMIQKATFEYGAQTITLALKNAGAAAGLSISKAASANISGRGAAETMYNLQVQEIAIQREVIKGQMSVAQAMFLNSQALERSTTQSKLNTVELKILNLEGLDPAKFDKEMANLQSEKRMLEKSSDTSDRTVEIIKGTKGSQNLIKAGRKESPEVAQSLMAYAAPLAGGEAQLSALAAQDKIAANEKVINLLREESAQKLKMYDLELKDKALFKEKLGKSREFFEISEAEFQAQDTKFELSARAIENSKAELALQTELTILKTAQAQTGEAAAKAALAISDKQIELNRTKAQGEAAIAAIKLDSDRKAEESLRVQSENLARSTIESSAAYGVSPEVIQAQLAAMDLAELQRKKASQSEIDSFTIKQKAIEYTALHTTAVRELGYEMEKVNNVQVRSISLAESMGKAFGKVGGVFSNITKAFAQSAVERTRIDEKLLKDKKALDEKYGKDSLTAAMKGVELEEAAAYDKERANVDSYANMAGAAKGFFDEKSDAFKAFAAIEQVLTLQSMALQVQALAVDTSTTAGYVANTLVKIGMSIKGAIAQALNNVFPYNLIAAGVVVAAAAAFGLMGGGGSVPAAPSSEELQKVQGTGQRYNAKGKLESTGYGVLGDDEAKSESITKSLELMAEYAFEELEYSNKMLSALQSIEKSLTGVSKGLVLTTGIMSGTAFGTEVGKSISKQWFLPMDLFSKISASIFGGKKTTNITGSGIQLGGNVGSLASGMGSAQQYETGSVTKSGGWFSSDKTSNFKNVANLSDSVKTSLTLTFDSIRDGLVEAGTALGLGSAELISKINSIPIDVSIELRNLKGKELEEAVTSVLSATMDMITEKALDIVKPYQKMGEGLAETAFRVANNSRVIDLQLKSVNKTFGSVGLGSLTLRERLLDLSGGLEEFTSASNYFKETFLSEAEKLVPIQKAVTDELSRLGLSAVNSRDKFKELVLGLDLSNVAQQDMYVSLMKLQKGFAAVYEASEDVSMSVKELAESKMTQMVRVMELLGDKTGVAITQRIQELKGMDARLKPMQKWIYALEDEVSARESLAEAYQTESDARQTAIEGLKTSRDTLLEFSKQLALGAQSPLTPGDKYATAKVNLSEVTAILDNKLSTPEETKKALAELPNAITSLLDTSKIFNASSDAFQQDYAYSQKLLQSNADSLSTQLTTAEQSLLALKTQADALGVIQINTININDSIKELTNLMAKSDVAKLLADLSSSGAATAQYLESMNKSTNKTDLQVMAPTDLYVKTLVSNGMAEFTASIAAEMKALKDEVIRLQEVTKASGIEIVYNNSQDQAASAEVIATAVKETSLVSGYYNNSNRNVNTYDL